MPHRRAARWRPCRSESLPSRLPLAHWARRLPSCTGPWTRCRTPSRSGWRILSLTVRRLQHRYSFGVGDFCAVSGALCSRCCWIIFEATEAREAPLCAGGGKKRKPSAGAGMPLQENVSQQQGSSASAARQEELLELRRLVTRTEVRVRARARRLGSWASDNCRVLPHFTYVSVCRQQLGSSHGETRCRPA